MFPDGLRIASRMLPIAVGTLIGVAVILCGTPACAFAQAKPHGQTTPTRPFRIFHVASYHLAWQWNIDQLNGFKAGLGDLAAKFRLFEMDTKRHSSTVWRKRAGAEARRQIDAWKPDLLYTNDDNAQEYVARHYVGTALPIVFSGVDGLPEDYGFKGSPNVTGVLERQHMIQTLALLHEIVPGVRKVAVIVDDGPTWPRLIERMKTALRQKPEVEVVAWDTIHTFAEYKRKVRGYQKTVDALGLLGVFTFKDDRGRNVPYQDVLHWTADHSALPDFSFWGDRPRLGTLCAVTVSGFEQGRRAGKMARAILLGEKTPAQIPMVRTARGVPVVSLARARRLGLSIPASVLLSSRVVKTFAWER